MSPRALGLVSAYNRLVTLPSAFGNMFIQIMPYCKSSFVEYLGNIIFMSDEINLYQSSAHNVQCPAFKFQQSEHFMRNAQLCAPKKKTTNKKRFFWNGPYWKPLWALQLKCCTRWQDQPSLCVGSTTANWIDRLMPCDPYDVKKSEVGRRCWCNVTLILWHLKVRRRICTYSSRTRAVCLSYGKRFN